MTPGFTKPKIPAPSHSPDIGNGGAASLPKMLTTRRLVLRPFALSDLGAYIAYYTGPRTAGVGGPKPRHVVAERFHAMAGQWALRGFGRYAIALNDVAIGHVGVLKIDDPDQHEMTWSLWDAVNEGKGYAFEAAHAVLRTWSGPNLVAQIDRENLASIRLAERLGFVEDAGAPKPALMPNARTFRGPEALR